MKKQFAFTFLALIAAVSAIAQGINFETGDWKSVVAKAKQSNRMVYVDVYTTWCGPCKMLEKLIFPQQEAGDKYNSLFVNYRIDAEKGEGVALAKKYAVNGYPTHLFIDPATEAVVYRNMGASAEVSEFNEHADVALKEKADPMTWDKYVAQRKTGKKDKAFLTAYLNKAKLLGRNNDAILNDYVAISKGKMSDSDIIFLGSMIQTVDNNAVAIVAANKEVINKSNSDMPDYFGAMASSWIYATYEKAVAEKNISLLKKLDDARLKYEGKSNDAQTYYYRTQYYTSIGDEANAFKAGCEEADFITAKSAADYAKEDAAGVEDAKASIRSQLKMMKVTDDKMDEMVEKNVKANPAILHSVSLPAASTLNNISWNVYEKKADDPAAVKRALGWSKRSMELSKDTNEWASFADTYAHLLYVSGDKTGAVKIQEEAVEKAKATSAENAASLEESLQKMKSGTL